MRQVRKTEPRWQVNWLALGAGLCYWPVCQAQLIQADLGAESISIAVDQHRFRGIHAAVVYSEQTEDHGWLAGLGYKAKSWLLGREQNLYVTTGAVAYAVEVAPFRANSIVWHNVMRYEPRRWQAVEFGLALDYGPEFLTYRDGEALWGVALQMDYRLTDRSGLVGGWRRWSLKTTSGRDIDVDRGGYVGLNWLF